MRCERCNNTSSQTHWGVKIPIFFVISNALTYFHRNNFTFSFVSVVGPVKTVTGHPPRSKLPIKALDNLLHPVCVRTGHVGRHSLVMSDGGWEPRNNTKRCKLI